MKYSKDSIVIMYQQKMAKLLNQFQVDRVILLDFHNQASKLEHELGERMKKIDSLKTTKGGNK